MNDADTLMNVVLFEDPAVARLAPLTLMRPAYTICCGSMCLADLAKELGGVVHGAVRPYLSDIQQDFIPAAEFDASQPTLLLNARLVPDATMLATLRQLIAAKQPFRMGSLESTLAALVPGETIRASHVDQSVALDLIGSAQPTLEPARELRLFDFPHEVIAEHIRVIQGNLEHRLASGAYEAIHEGVYKVGAVNISEHVVFDTSDGTVLLEDGATIGPFTVVKGPTHIGAKSEISPHTYLKGHLGVGHTCKIGGEVSKSSIEPCCNKVHYGYLGSSYVGCWVNLGAGTSNSNLKNTYGSVRVQYDEQKIDTGMQFLGCMIGDFSKTAINTSIYTGKTIGVCSNLYGVVTANVPSFANYAQDFGEVSELPPEVMEIAQRRTFARRGIEQRACDVQLLHDVYKIEARKRELPNRPPSF